MCFCLPNERVHHTRGFATLTTRIAQSHHILPTTDVCGHSFLYESSGIWQGFVVENKTPKEYVVQCDKLEIKYITSTS